VIHVELFLLHPALDRLLNSQARAMPFNSPFLSLFWLGARGHDAVRSRTIHVITLNARSPR